MTWLYVFLGGGLGSLARYGIGQWMPAVDLAKGGFPWATLLANLLACIVLGIGIGLASRALLSRPLQLLLLTGFCGGFSTFSTFALEATLLLEEGYTGVALAYVGISLLGGFFALYLALLVGR